MRISFSDYVEYETEFVIGFIALGEGNFKGF